MTLVEIRQELHQDEAGQWLGEVALVLEGVPPVLAKVPASHLRPAGTVPPLPLRD